MALATLQIAAIPLLAGLAAGTGAVATYVAAPPVPAVAATVQDCSTQAWPYVARACVADVAAAEERKVRLVTAPRAGEAFAARWAEVPAQPSAAAPAGFTTSDGVLRGPQDVDAVPDVPAQPPKAKQPEVKREKRTHDAARAPIRRFSVPVERSDETREVIVIRPLRYD